MRAAVSVAGESLDHDSLYAAAHSMADRVRGCGPVAIDATATLDTVVAILGCQLAGVVVVPVPPDSGPREREHILSDSGAVPLERLSASAADARGTATDDAALILYTSGTRFAS